MKTKPYIVAAASLAVLYFVIEGGEYGTSDLVRLRTRHDSLDVVVRGLRAEVRDLRRLERAVETDPATQERIAREEFGLVRERELLYRFTPSRDSATAAADSARDAARP